MIGHSVKILFLVTLTVFLPTVTSQWAVLERDSHFLSEKYFLSGVGLDSDSYSIPQEPKVDRLRIAPLSDRHK